MNTTHIHIKVTDDTIVAILRDLYEDGFPDGGIYYEDPELEDLIPFTELVTINDLQGKDSNYASILLDYLRQNKTT